MVEPWQPHISVRRQCELVGLSRAAPYYGIRRVAAWLRTQGYQVNHKRVQRRLRLMGLEAIDPKPHLGRLGAGPQIYPYLLRGVNSERLKVRGLRISMDGRGRALDHIFVERLWRTLKYEEVSRHDYRSVPEAIRSLGRYVAFYKSERLQQALNYQ